MHIVYGHPPLQDHMITPHHLPARVDFSLSFGSCAKRLFFQLAVLVSTCLNQVCKKSAKPALFVLFIIRLFHLFLKATCGLFLPFFHADFAMTLL